MARCTTCNQYVRGLDGVCDECTGVVRSVLTEATPVPIASQEKQPVPERLPTQAKLPTQVRLPTQAKLPAQVKLPPQVKPPTPEVLPKPISRVSPATVSAITKRYADAYAIARVIEYVGGAIKVFGMFIAALLGMLAIIRVGSSSPTETTANVAIIVIAGITAVIPAIIFYIVGTLVSAKAQVLKASLDTAVNSSPFLDDQHKLAIMSLPGLD